MGFLGAVLMMKWSTGLLKTPSAVLLDEQMFPIECEKIRKAIESNDKHRILNLLAWIIGAGACAGINSVVSINPPHPSSHYKVLIEKIIKLKHLCSEMHPFKKSHENKLLQIARLTAPL